MSVDFQENADFVETYYGKGGIFSRLYIYSYVFIVITLLVTFSNIAKTDFEILAPGTILIIIFEIGITVRRKKDNLPVYKNVSNEIFRRELDKERELKELDEYVKNMRAEKAAKVQRAKTSAHELDYYFGLYQKGAITQEEYEIKKMDLLR